jgi:dTMP kinase
LNVSALFISFEGGEGSGKSTQLKLLAERLLSAGHAVHVTREPGGTPLGEKIRHLLKHDDAGRDMCAVSELLLFAASRAQLVRKVLRPKLSEGCHVLCDRFYDSTSVYQGVARQLPAAVVESINAIAINELKPDITFLCDLPPEIGLTRARDRNQQVFDRMENEALPFYQAVRQAYLNLADTEPNRFHVIDATTSPEVINQTIWNVVSQFIN